MTEDKKGPVDAVVDLLVFAPLGLAAIARDQLPELISKGRSQVTGQITMARIIGQFAVREGEKDLRKRLGGVAETLSAFGLLPEQPDPAAAAAPEAAAHKAEEPAPSRPALDSSALSIPGYDTLSASQVVQRLGGLAAAELEAVRSYESAARGRRTILSKISQLQSGPA